MDSDETGKIAKEEALKRFPNKQIFILKFSSKDLNEALLKGEKITFSG